MAVAVYMRVSTSKQTVASQRREVKRYLNAHRMTDVRWFIDEGVSGCCTSVAADRLLRLSFSNIGRQILTAGYPDRKHNHQR